MSKEIHCTYLCPIRSTEADTKKIKEFREYFDLLKTLKCEVLVVDGSPDNVFEMHANEWTSCTHVKVDSKYTYLNGKVNGILTAVPIASHEKIVLADDDIRYSEADLRRMVDDLNYYELVRPQNYFNPLPIWAKLDAARILLNRAFIREGDFPGTVGFRKSVFIAAGPFDGDVLFDNEELVKHLQNYGAKIKFSNDFFVLRKPPTFNKWIEQRPRQAYEDFVMKEKTAFFLSLIPVHLILGLSGRKRQMSILALSLSILAIRKALSGRQKEARRFFPFETTFYAPVWLVERSLSVYLAVYWKLMKGGYPFGDKLIKKGTGEAWKKVPQQV